MTTSTAPAPVRPPVATVELTAEDRCDRCGAQAYVEVEIAPEISRLLFCSHHGAKHEMKWATEGFKITQDNRERLQPKSQKGEVY